MESLSTSSRVVLRVSRPESASMLSFLEKVLLEQDPIRSYDRVWYGMHDEGSWHLSKFNTWSKVALRVSRARFQSLRWRHQYPQSTLSHPIQQLIKSTNIPEDGSTGVNKSHFENGKPRIQIGKNWAPGMHLWDFKRAGMQIWDLCMLKMSDTGNHSESCSEYSVYWHHIMWSTYELSWSTVNHSLVQGEPISWK